MPAGPANLVDEMAAETLKLGTPLIRLTLVYEVFTDSRSEPSSVVLAAPELPALRAAYTYNGTELYCVGRTPRRQSMPDTGRKWHVNVEYTNDNTAFLHDAFGIPVSDPTNAVKRVEIDYTSREEPIFDAKLRNLTVGPFADAYDSTKPDFVDPQKLAATPSHLADRISTGGPIVNSAGDIRYATAPSFQRRLTIRKWVSSWSPTIQNDYLGGINDSEVLIEEGYGGTTTAEHRFPPLTLRVEDVFKRDVWLNGRLYYEATVVLQEDKKTWIHSEIDAGQRMRVSLNLLDIDGSTFTTEKLQAYTPPIADDEFRLVDIEREGIAPGDPMKLNGVGGIYNTEDETYFVNFNKFKIVDFSGLDLT